MTNFEILKHKTMNEIQLFEAQKVRTSWNETEEQWYFSIVDVMEALTGTERPRKYWSDLKAKLTKEDRKSVV